MMIDHFMHTYFYHRINHDRKRVAIELCAHIWLGEILSMLAVWKSIRNTQIHINAPLTFTRQYSLLRDTCLINVAELLPLMNANSANGRPRRRSYLIYTCGKTVSVMFTVHDTVR